MDSIPAALYARKSADEKLSPRSSVETQILEIRDWAERNGFQIVEEYVDDAWKGWDLSRPRLNAMLEKARGKGCPFRAIIVADWDRFMRRMGYACIYADELEAQGIELISVRGGRSVSRNEKIGRNVSFFIAETENIIRGGHILAGQKRWASEGYSPGGKIPFGYRRLRVEDDRSNIRVKYEPHPDEAPVVVRIYTWYAEGVPMTEILKRLQKDEAPSPSGKGWRLPTIHKILAPHRQEKYSGSMIFNRTRVYKDQKRAKVKDVSEWISCPDAHPAIISPELLALVRKRQEKETTPPKRSLMPGRRRKNSK